MTRDSSEGFTGFTQLYLIVGLSIPSRAQPHVRGLAILGIHKVIRTMHLHTSIAVFPTRPVRKRQRRTNKYGASLLWEFTRVFMQFSRLRYTPNIAGEKHLKANTARCARYRDTGAFSPCIPCNGTALGMDARGLGPLETHLLLISRTTGNGIIKPQRDTCNVHQNQRLALSKLCCPS